MIFFFQYKTVRELIIMELNFTLGPQIKKKKVVPLTVMTGILKNRKFSDSFSNAIIEFLATTP